MLMNIFEFILLMDFMGYILLIVGPIVLIVWLVNYFKEQNQQKEQATHQENIKKRFGKYLDKDVMVVDEQGCEHTINMNSQSCRVKLDNKLIFTGSQWQYDNEKYKLENWSTNDIVSIILSTTGAFLILHKDSDSVSGDIYRILSKEEIEIRKAPDDFVPYKSNGNFYTAFLAFKSSEGSALIKKKLTQQDFRVLYAFELKKKNDEDIFTISMNGQILVQDAVAISGDDKLMFGSIDVEKEKTGTAVMFRKKDNGDFGDIIVTKVNEKTQHVTQYVIYDQLAEGEPFETRVLKIEELKRFLEKSR